MPSRVRHLLVAACLATGLLAASAGSAGAAAVRPAVAYVSGDALVLAGPGGQQLRRLPWAERYSMDGRVLASSVYDDRAETDTLTVRDAVTGSTLTRIRHARGPAVVRDGAAVLFGSDRMGHRDPQVNSVWLRDLRAGTTRKLVQFSNGPGLPGVPTGLDAVAPLQVVTDDAARWVAITEGNDVDLFHYDVWLLDTRTGAVERRTTGGRSRYPALAPAGARLAVTRDVADCGTLGWRASDVLVMGTARGPARTLLHGSCATSWTDLAWSDDEHLVAVRQSRTPDGTYVGTLVRIAVDSGRVTPLSDVKGVVVPVVSPGLQRVAFQQRDRDGFAILRLGGGLRWVPTGAAPTIRGSHARF
ncbi:MAG TPA: hypothetical protein VFR07_02760 [Mycobacteriales bacterium]|jgi:hypothetical protein|nr:hypothetical protein [Mycobacteriales bacterium]